MDKIKHHIINKQFTTPSYIYDAEIIDYQIQELTSALDYNYNIYYSVKANPNPSIVSYIAERVAGVEVSSAGELYLALRANVAADKILFIGPGKTIDELAYALSSRIRAIVVESCDELKIVCNLATQHQIQAPIALRINPTTEKCSGRLKMSGNSQFGIPIEHLSDACAILDNYRYVTLVGLHFYFGTQILLADQIIKNSKLAASIVQNFFMHHKYRISFIDFGGGFGVPYKETDKPLCMRDLKQGFQQIARELKQIPYLADVELIVECGRFIMAPSGFFVTKVLYKKLINQQLYIIVDGGSNLHSAAAGIGRISRHNFPISAIQQIPSPNYELVNVVGPLCTPTDILATNVSLPIVEAGDYLMFALSGAYGWIASSPCFLGHELPEEILIKDGTPSVIRHKGTKKDLYNFFNGSSK